MKPETLKPGDPPEVVSGIMDEHAPDAPETEQANDVKHETDTSVFDTLHDLDPGFHKENENETQQNADYDGTADGFHGRKIERPPSGTFLTSIEETDQNKVYDELGIYEDTDVGDDLSDSELELERLRTEKIQREKEEKEKLVAELKKQRELFEKQKAERERLNDPLVKYERFIADNLTNLTPRTDVSNSSRMTIKTWSDPKFLQGLSLKEIQWKMNTEEIPVTKSMKTEIQQSR